MKKKIIMILTLFCMIATLYACGAGGEVEKNTETSQLQESQVEEHYSVKITDEEDNPIAGVTVQLCSESCVLGKSNEEGVAEFERPKGDYKVSLLSLPEGYEYPDERNEFYFEEDSKEITIVLKIVK